jgi:hypothetical protein
MSNPGDSPVGKVPNGSEQWETVEGSEDSDVEAGVQRGGHSPRPRPSPPMLIYRPRPTTAVFLRQPIGFRCTRSL